MCVYAFDNVASENHYMSHLFFYNFFLFFLQSVSHIRFNRFECNFFVTYSKASKHFTLFIFANSSRNCSNENMFYAIKFIQSSEYVQCSPYKTANRKSKCISLAPDNFFFTFSFLTIPKSIG